MKRHVIFDRTERLFSRGQRALQAFDFPRAAEVLQRAIDTDGEYPHLYLYLAIASAEMERLEVAETLLGKAVRLAPLNFVFPLHLGIVHLDAGHPETARGHFRHAATLTAGNPLVAGYEALASWDTGSPEALAAVLPRVRDLPSSFRARALVRVEDRRLGSAGPRACLKTFSDHEGEPARAGWLRGVKAWMARRRVRQARALVAAGAFEEAVTLLAKNPGWAMDEPASAVLKGARTGAAAGLEREIATFPDGRDTGRRRERQRRRLLLTLASLRGDLADEPAAHPALAQWLDSFDRSGRPSREFDTAAHLLVWMAEIDVARAEYARASRLCARARELQRLSRIEWVDAIAHLGAGERRQARQRFERFLDMTLVRIEPAMEAWLKDAA